MGTPVRKILQAKYNIWKPCWYNKDRYGYAGLVMTVGAVRYGNNIYAVYQDYQASAARNLYITKYNGTQWEGTSIKCSDTNLYSAGDISADGHGGPSIVRSLDGHLHVFGGCHDNDVAYGYSTNADDISDWTNAESRVSGAGNSNKAIECSYPIAFVAPDTGAMVLLFRYRVVNTHYKLAMMSSTDNGLTWSTRTDFYDETHPTRDVGGANYWWPYHVAGMCEYITNISGSWYIEYNWNARTYYNAPYKREHQFYARLKFSDMEFYDKDGVKRSTDHTFSTAEVNSYFMTYSSSDLWCAGTTHICENGLVLQVLYRETATSYYAFQSREYVNGTWSDFSTLATFSRTPDSVNAVLFEYNGKTYCSPDQYRDSYAVARERGIPIYEYNWNNHTWKRVSDLLKNTQAERCNESAFLGYPQWCGTVPTEPPVIHVQDVGYANGNRGYVFTINREGAMEVVADGTNLEESTGVNTAKQTSDFTITFDKGVYHAINSLTGKIDYYNSNFNTVLQNVLDALPNGTGTIATIKGIEGSTEIVRYVNRVPVDIKANLLSDAFAIDSATTVTVTVTHNLPYAPPVESIAVSLIEKTNVDDWVAVPRVVSTDDTYIYCKVKVSTASGTAGATARLGLKVDIR